MQFGFMYGKGITDAIFIMQQVQKRHQARKTPYQGVRLAVTHGDWKFGWAIGMHFNGRPRGNWK